MHLPVHEHATGVDLGREPLSARPVGGPERRPEAVRGVVGDPDRLVLVADADHGGDRPERLLLEHWHPGVDGDEHGRRVEGAWAVGHAATEQEPRAETPRLLHLPVQLVAEIVARLRAHLRGAVERITHPAGRHLVDEEAEEALGHRLDDDEALGRYAALPAVDETRVGGDVRRARQVRVGEDHERVAAA